MLINNSPRIFILKFLSSTNISPLPCSGKILTIGVTATQEIHLYSLPRKIRCDYQVANGTSELLAEFERSGEEQILAPGGGFYAFVEDFRGGNSRMVRLEAMNLLQDCIN